MDLSRRRSSIVGGIGTPLPSVVAAGSIWESRMKIDEVRGGFKVFNGDENGDSSVVASVEEITATVTTPPKPRKAKQSNAHTPKRKQWRSDTSEGLGRSVIVDGVAKKSPITPAKTKRVLRSEASKDIERKSPVPRRIVKKKPDSDHLKVKIPDEIGSPEEEEEENVCKDFEVYCDEETIAIDDVAVEFDDDDEVVVVDEEIEVVEIKEIKAEETKPERDDDQTKETKREETKPEKDDDQIKEIKAEETKPEREDDQTKEIKREETKPEKDDDQIKEIKAKDVSEVKRVNFERKLEVRLHNNNVSNKSRIFHRRQSEPISMNVSIQSPVIKRATVHSSFPKKSQSNSNAYQNFPESHSRLQSFVDLIMWKDISRSVFIFGIGTFTILSSSYTKDLNISFISVISYLCLVYLAAIFLFRSIICRGVIDMDYRGYVLGEEEAIWLLKLVLPYLNEFLLKLKDLFSGDPATTMKLAVLLLIFARCGSSITIWTTAKLSFFGVFTVPKVCSLYATHITAYATFWVRRFRDAWDSCSHKKGVTISVFLLVWNLSSIVARIWAVFMLFVAFRYYQQNLVASDWVEDGPECEETSHEPIGLPKYGN